MPKVIEKLAMFFPFFHLLLITGSLFYFWQRLDFSSFLYLLFSVYLFPLLLWRLISLKYPLVRGLSVIGANAVEGSAWIVAHRLQYLFLTFSAFEKILILIPGFFSFWLRCWGSQIGKSVIWTPQIRVLDRTGLIIGNFCFLGDKAYLSSHFITRKENKLILLYDSISIGNRVLIGAHSHLGPGAKIKDQEFIPTYSKMMKGRFIKGNEGGYEL